MDFAEDKALYHGQSLAESEVTKKLTDGGVASMDDIKTASSSISSFKSAALKRAAMADAVKLMKEDPAWSEGLGICCISSAMTDAYVLLDKTVAECEQFVNDNFNYDGIIIQNPKGARTVPRSPCALATWGLCVKSLILTHCQIGTWNLYTLMKQHKIG